MTCPLCSESMRDLMMDAQHVLHCANCGATFFEDNGINRISYEHARELSSEHYIKSQSPKPTKVTCPHDETVLEPLVNEGAIPRDLTILKCPQCLGLLVTASQLTRFKHAQVTKLDYYKAWGLPLGSLRTVFAIFAILVASSTIWWGYNTVQYGQSIRSEASQLIKNIGIKYSSDYMLISFATKSPYMSSLIIDNQSAHSISIMPISSTPRTTHTISVLRPVRGVVARYHIRLSDTRGNTVDLQDLDVKMR